MQRRHQYSGRGVGETSHKTDAIEELKNAFELAERASPGISDQFVREMVQKLLPALTEARLKTVMDKITRYTENTECYLYVAPKQLHALNKRKHKRRILKTFHFKRTYSDTAKIPFKFVQRSFICILTCAFLNCTKLYHDMIKCL